MIPREFEGNESPTMFVAITRNSYVTPAWMLDDFWKFRLARSVYVWRVVNTEPLPLFH
jgi:hypothetical protein